MLPPPVFKTGVAPLRLHPPWRPYRESNPAYEDENLVSLPIDDRDLAPRMGIEPISTRLDKPPSTPDGLTRHRLGHRDSNPDRRHQKPLSYRWTMAECSWGGRIRTLVAGTKTQSPAAGRHPKEGDRNLGHGAS